MLEGYRPGRWYLANHSVVGMVLFLSHFSPVPCLEHYFVQAENLALNNFFACGESRFSFCGPFGFRSEALRRVGFFLIPWLHEVSSQKIDFFKVP